MLQVLFIPDFTPAWNTLQGMARDAMGRAPYYVVGLVVFGIAYVLSKRVRLLLVTGANRAHRGASFSVLVGRIGGAMVVLAGALVAATVIFPSFTPATLFSVLGFGGVAASFALRDILGNLLCGLMILASEPFRIGDRIEVKGFQGKVEDVQTRATTIRTRDGKRIVIPNTVVFNEPVEVVTAFSKRRLDASINLTGDDWDDDKERAIEAMKKVLEVEDSPEPAAFLLELKDTGATLGLRWWIDNESAEVESRSRDAVLSAVAKALRKPPAPEPSPIAAPAPSEV
ncbi:mechanosensitive ion channel family protein [bacterium]|nr:MAG: mechanosensitive ion channel family protein [bacterium]